MKMKKITFQGWKNCIELTNGEFRIVVTTEIGPRIVGAFLGPKGANLLYLDKKLLGTSNQKVWTNYGGHRIWHAPEDSVRSYCPDSRKVVMAELRDGGVAFMAPREELTGIVKTINVYPEGNNSFRIEHQIRNEGLWDIEAAAWGITQLMPGGTAILPEPTERGLFSLTACRIFRYLLSVLIFVPVFAGTSNAIPGMSLFIAQIE